MYKELKSNLHSLPMQRYSIASFGNIELGYGTSTKVDI